MATLSEMLVVAQQRHQAGQLLEAQTLFREILASDPSCVDAWHLLGTVASEARNAQLAVECFERAIQLKPDHAAAYNNLGNVLRNQNRFDQAIACYQRALEFAAWVPEIHNNLGVALRDKKEPSKAVHSFRNALALKPDYFEALNNLGNALKDQGLLDDAVQCYRRAAELNPQHAMVLDNLGLACLDLGRLEEAARCFHRSLELDPSSPHVHWCRSLLLLLTGNWEQGWSEHEWRWKCPDWRRYCNLYLPREREQPVWDGSGLTGRTILLQAEQGLGDTVQFIRYVPLVKQFGGTVLLECQRPLVRLLRECGADEIIGEGGTIPPFEVRAALLSLPAILKTTLDTIPAEVPYLFANRELVSHWRQRLAEACQTPDEVGQQAALRIGVNWRGRADQGVFRLRDFPLASLQGLAKCTGVRLISLQRGEGREELAAVAETLPIVDLGDEVDTVSGAFMDTAAIMTNLDLVITSDTAVAHLAGALGVPVWVALPFAADWRWLLNRTDSPWYPTMRLFRQKSPGDWASVFAEIETALRQPVASKR